MHVPHLTGRSDIMVIRNEATGSTVQSTQGIPVESTGSGQDLWQEQSSSGMPKVPWNGSGPPPRGYGRMSQFRKEGIYSLEEQAKIFGASIFSLAWIVFKFQHKIFVCEKGLWAKGLESSKGANWNNFPAQGKRWRLESKPGCGTVLSIPSARRGLQASAKNPKLFSETRTCPSPLFRSL